MPQLEGLRWVLTPAAESWLRWFVALVEVVMKKEGYLLFMLFNHRSLRLFAVSVGFRRWNQLNQPGMAVRLLRGGVCARLLTG